MTTKPASYPIQTTRNRPDRFLLGVLLALILIVGWGRIQITGGLLHFSIGGSTGAICRLLILAYVGTRLATAMWRLNLSFPCRSDPLVWFFGVGTVSVAWNAHHDLTQIERVVLPAFVAYVTARYLLDRDFEGVAPLLLRALVAALTLVVPHLLIQNPTELLHFSQLDAPEEHHTHIAMRMVIAMPLTIAFLQIDRRWRPFWAGTLLLQVLGLTIANSRIGWMALAAIAVHGLFFSRAAAMRRSFIAAATLVLVLAFAFPAVRRNFTTLGTLTSEENYLRRVVIYRTDLSLIASHPLLGLGFSSRTFTEAGRALEPGFYYEHPHDLVLQVLVYLGLPGLITFAWVVVGTWQAVRGMRTAGVPIPLAQGISGAFVGFCVMNVAESALSSERVAFMVAGLLALVLHRRRGVQGVGGEGPGGGSE